MYRTEIIALDNGRVRIEQQQKFGDSWVTVERYKADSPSDRPKRRDRTASPKRFNFGHIKHEQFVEDTVKLCSQPKANLDIAVPTMPSTDKRNVFERLADEKELSFEMSARLEDLQQRITNGKNYSGEKVPCPCTNCLTQRLSLTNANHA